MDFPDMKNHNHQLLPKNLQNLKQHRTVHEKLMLHHLFVYISFHQHMFALTCEKSSPGLFAAFSFITVDQYYCIINATLDIRPTTHHKIKLLSLMECSLRHQVGLVAILAAVNSILLFNYSDCSSYQTVCPVSVSWESSSEVLQLQLQNIWNRLMEELSI